MAKGGRLVPVCREVDIGLTPLEGYCALRGGGFSFFLDSARTHPATGRYSFIGAEPFLIFKAKGSLIEIESGLGTKRIKGNPFRVLKGILDGYRALGAEWLPDFVGGGVGYISYDCLHFFEDVPKNAVDDLLLPDIYLMFVDVVTAFDHFENKTKVIAVANPCEGPRKAYDRAIEKIEAACGKLTSSSDAEGEGYPGTAGGIRSNFTRNEFEAVAKKAKGYIRAGDIYQANLSHRFKIRCDAGAFELYKALRQINPSPFACFLDFGDLKIASSSPERLLKVVGRDVQTRPIAGTRPTGCDSKENLENALELILSDKERAEHVMLLDLERNDLGRVCEYGSVRADEFMALEEYSHVIHIVSNVRGRLRQGLDRFDLIRAAFPGGTITGCPKVRCMQIIDELEPVVRGPYTGSAGFFSFNGDMDLNILIRSFVINGTDAYVQVGAGIVADSDPTREYYETLYKAEALLKALEIIKRPSGFVAGRLEH